VRSRQSLDGFVRTTLVRGLIDTRRRPWRREHSRAVVPDGALAESMALEDRLAVRAALAQVPV
jgi:DNA-directed RNA polymerase specialized sigma24 family protein